MSAGRLVGPHVALVGEAAHAMSPVGAQGLNTSLADVAALARAVSKSLREGRPVSQPDALIRYERERLPDIQARLLVTDGLARAVATAFPAIVKARGLGLRLVGSLPPLQAPRHAGPPRAPRPGGAATRARARRRPRPTVPGTRPGLP